MEEDHRAYREVIAVGVQVLRPHTEVSSVRIEELEGAMARLDPDVVISNVANRAGYGERLAWVELSLDPARPSIISVGRRRFERTNPGLDMLLEIVDEAERLSGMENPQHVARAPNRRQSGS